MPIPVICPGCKKSYRVSDKFAGKTGPCPGCGTKITVPKVAEEVKIHAPEPKTGRDSKGRPLSKPIVRIETKVSTTAKAIGFGAAFVVVVATWLLGRGGVLAENAALLLAGLIIISPPLAVVGYLTMRDEEALEVYQGMNLWIRGGICGLVYAGLWVAFGFVPTEAYQQAYAWLYLAPPFVIVGGLIALACFDLPFGNAVLHYCLYLAATMFLRYLAGMNALWNPIT